MHVDLEDLGFERGGALLVKRALRMAAVGETITVAGRQPDLSIHLRAWCRAEGHEFRLAQDSSHAQIVRGPASDQRWSAAERAGRADPHESGAVSDTPSQRWGLAARGALVEGGSPEFHFALDRKIEVWSGDAARMYAQAAAAQWDPATAVPWEAEFDLPTEVEDAIGQIMSLGPCTSHGVRRGDDASVRHSARRSRTTRRCAAVHATQRTVRVSQKAIAAVIERMRSEPYVTRDRIEFHGYGRRAIGRL